MNLRPSRRDARLASGLVLFAYVAAHLINHALGLISIGVAERGLRIAVAVWHSVPGTMLLYGAAATHIALAFVAVYERRTLRLPPIELLRIVLGFAMPTLLIAHAVSTRLAFEIYGHPTDYAHVVWTLWHSGREGMQIALLVPGWIHGCLGLKLAFGKRPWFARVRFALFAAALLIPVLAVLGFVSMLKEVIELAAAPGWVATVVGTVSSAERDAMALLGDRARLVYFAAIAAMLAARAVRSAVERRRGSLVAIAYPDRVVRVPRNWSVLEASRSHRIAHMSSCGGRGRCSTCRVRIVDGAEYCPPPSADEQHTLARVGASADTRLACQLRPKGDIGVVPLVPVPHRSSRPDEVSSSEHELVAMLVTARWSRQHGRLLPHDRLYAAHRFLETVASSGTGGQGVAAQHGADRILVLFGLGESARDASRAALKAADEIGRALEGLNDSLHRTIGCRSRFAIRLQIGRIAIGRPDAAAMSEVVAAGDPIDWLSAAASADADEARDPGDGTTRPMIWASPEVRAAAGVESLAEIA